MDPAVDPFHPLIRLVDRYRREVHSLQPGASEDAIRAAERHLGHRLPLTLGGFLRRWNGAVLFRGALLVRGTSELAPVREELPGLVAFADMPGAPGQPARSFVYAHDGRGDFVFGELVGDKLVPANDRFDRWLKASLRILDEDIYEPAARLEARLDADPEGGYLLLQRAEVALRQGDPVRSRRCLQRAVAADPGLIRAWQRLGESHLSDGDASQGRFALLRALRASRLPLPFPGAQVLSADGLSDLERLFPKGDAGWERELSAFLEERVSDVRSPSGAALYEAVVLALSRVLLHSHGRKELRSLLFQSLERTRSFALSGRWSGLQLALVEVETDLGLHDEAERHLRPLLRSEKEGLRARAHLALARIAVRRQEPWAEDILDTARGGLTRPADKARAHLLRGERQLLLQHLDEAEAAYSEADPWAVQAADRSLQGAVCVGLGDVARLRGDLRGAQQAYRVAAEHAEVAGDQELALRAELRGGDLCRLRGQNDQALETFIEVAQGYRRLQLPLREAWALLRVARIAHEQNASEALRIARSRFADPGVQLAAGVGACDALAGDPGASLSWHLECSAAHARARHEAQRARPPLTRADADRPERRLATHRIAIAAAGLGVVEALAAELNDRARELENSHARSSDPSVVRYVAAVDLLAYHRSYEAAQVLLDQLLNRRLPELPTRALRGAITRSPNAALVDGLLEAVEKVHDPVAAAGAAEILGWRKEPAAVPALRRIAEQSRSRGLRRAAVVALGRIGDREAVPALLPLLDLPELAEEVAIALLLLGDRRGVDFHGQALASGQELKSAPGEIVGRYGGPSYLLLLLGTAAGEGTRALAALQGLGYLGDARGIPRLLGALGSRDRSKVAVASSALELLTGHREDPDEPGVHARWERWWEDNGSTLEEGIRYRYGEILTPELLVRALGDDDALVRRGAYDELVISTSCTLPFDSEGPYRLQIGHQRAWKQWAHQNAHRFPPGAWWFDGGLMG
ncbi:MAG: HEAT repeat domain-containing protein [Myxococcota bacterium]|nr:HEAT repeat domain-containing protein [Myxococcota bacterium]